MRITGNKAGRKNVGHEANCLIETCCLLQQSISFIGGTTLAVLVATCLAAGRLCEIQGPRFLATVGTVITVAGLLGASWCRSVNSLIATQGESIG